MIFKRFRKSYVAMAIAIITTVSIDAQNETSAIWEGDIPGSIDAFAYVEEHDTDLDRLRNVKIPTLTVFVPEQPNGTSVIVCPGGGYAYLAIKKEGYKVAEWLNTLGITAFVLKYRLPSDRVMQDMSIGPLQDAQESVRYIRRNAKKWQLDSDKIGIMGFSAGGHLAATLATKYDEITYQPKDTLSAKPNFSLLIYPVISMTDEISHKGSRQKLLGTYPSEKLIEKFSAEKQVTAETAAAFLVHAMDDKGVPAENSIRYAMALKKHQVRSELHVYENGGHGFGLGKEGTSQFWTIQCEAWLRQNKLIN